MFFVDTRSSIRIIIHSSVRIARGYSRSHETSQYKVASLGWDRGVAMASKGLQMGVTFLAVRRQKPKSDRLLQMVRVDFLNFEVEHAGSTSSPATFFSFFFNFLQQPFNGEHFFEYFINERNSRTSYFKSHLPFLTQS